MILNTKDIPHFVLAAGASFASDSFLQGIELRNYFRLNQLFESWARGGFVSVSTPIPTVPTLLPGKDLNVYDFTLEGRTLFRNVCTGDKNPGRRGKTFEIQRQVCPYTIAGSAVLRTP